MLCVGGIGRLMAVILACGVVVVGACDGLDGGMRSSPGVLPGGSEFVAVKLVLGVVVSNVIGAGETIQIVAGGGEQQCVVARFWAAVAVYRVGVFVVVDNTSECALGGDLDEVSCFE